MPGTITVNLTDPALAEAFVDAKTGDSITLDRVTFTVGAKDAAKLDGAIEEFEYAGESFGYEESDETDMSEETPEPASKPMPAPMGKMGMMGGKPMPPRG